DLSLPRTKYSDPIRQREFFERLDSKLWNLPGVDAAGGAMPLPFSGNDRASSFWIAGRPDPGLGNHPNAGHLVIDGDYFRALRIPLLTGRTFSPRDNKDSLPAVMVNAAFVRKFFNGGNAIGEHILLDASEREKPTSLDIAGVAMVLAAIGIYGVIAYTVAQRTKEIGIRMALGAQKIDMLTMILRQSFTVIGIGLLVGLFGALAVTRLMSSLLYGVSANDL